MYHSLCNSLISVINDVYQQNIAHFERNVRWSYTDRNLFVAYRDLTLKHIFQTIGTMKTAREKNIRNALEFLFEMMAQYLVTGKVTFKPLDKVVKFGNRKLVSTFDQKDLDFYNQTLFEISEEMNDGFKLLFDEALYNYNSYFFVM